MAGRSREGLLCGLWRWVGKGRAGGGEQGWCRQDGAVTRGVRQPQGVEARLGLKA